MVDKKYEVESKYSGYLSIQEAETKITRIFPHLGSKMYLTKDSILRMSYTPGGRYILKNNLIIHDKEILKLLELDLEYEDSFSKEEIKSLLEKGSLAQLEDALDFGNQGTLELIKDVAMEIKLSDINKRIAISKKIGCDLNKMIEILEILPETTEEKETGSHRRSSELFTPNKEKEEEKTTYKMVNGQRVLVKE